MIHLVVIAIACFSVAEAGVIGSCNFDNGLCGYTQGLNDNFDWTLNNGSTPSPNTGPSNDQNVGNGQGFYMYIETSWPRLNHEKAVLMSPVLPSNAECVRFWYHMKGINIRTLNVYIEEKSGSRKLEWSLSGKLSDNWQLAKISFQAGQEQKIVFEGISGYGYMGDIALDNVHVSEVPCTTTPEEAIPQPPVKLLDADLPPMNDQCGRKPLASRIVGGNATIPGTWPWQAMLTFKRSENDWRQFCGGTLVDPNWVVTASHCVDSVAPQEYDSIRIRLGAHYRNLTYETTPQDIDVERIFVHAEYNSFPYALDNDIALIKLKRPALTNNRVNLACLPDHTVSFGQGTECYITGWGTMSPGGNAPLELQEAMVPLVSTAECTKNGSYPANEISPRMLCAGFPGKGGVDSCQGDSGGPLVCENRGQWYLVGVTSWGYSCADKRYPGIYARVTELKQWLANIMDRN